MGPEVISRWMREAAHMLEEPGAQPAEKQMADNKRFDGEMAAWLRGFLDRWLA
jgi:hypothetical protein